ncbi:alpha/beta hydrolase [Pseudonocardia nematodicida]|uniref:Alpha/beta hydrolase n=1 Tax=Pseudonocardia nematodicida TaxID=1206997 RepID=A0ABV1K5S6_9PSEU
MPVPTDPAPPLRHLDVSGARLAFWDTGGDGPVVLFLHARSGSHRSWPYQCRELVRAGLRVVAYSRRGHQGSCHETVGYGTDDLVALLDEIGVERAHLVGHAAGGVWALDAALARPDRAAGLVLANTTFGLREPEFHAATEQLRPPGFEELPATFRELGPNYRSADPDGVRAWSAIERDALTGTFFFQGFRSPMTWSALESLAVPTLLVSTDADLYMTPHLVSRVAERIRGARHVTIAAAGHCPHWERPTEFNAAIIAHALDAVVP